jgi:hypothetical protein
MAWKSKRQRERERAESLEVLQKMLRPDDPYVVQAAGWWLGMLVKRQRIPSSDWSMRQAMLKRKIFQMAQQLGLDAEKVAACVNEVAR